MKQLSKLSLVIGLTGILNGCDENEKRKLAECEVGNLKVKVINDIRHANYDRIYLNFYLDKHLVGTVMPMGSYDSEYYTTAIHCNDGRIMHIEQNNFDDEYFTEE